MPNDGKLGDKSDTSRFFDDQWYVVDGVVMNMLWRLTEQLCNSGNEASYEVGRQMQLHLERSPRLAKKISRGIRG